MLFAMMFFLCARGAWGEDVPVYTFATSVNAYNSLYGSVYSVTIDDIEWYVPGNQSFSGFVRIGGNSITRQNRVITGKGAITSAIKKITLNHNGRSNSNLTVHSISVTVASDAAFASIIETKTISSPSISVSTSGSLDFTPTSESWAESSYYKFTFNLSNSTKTNYGLDVVSIVFYGEGAEPADEESVTIGSAGYTTYVARHDISFPEEVTAFIATAKGSESITLTSKSSVPEGTPVVVRGSAGTYALPTIETTPDDVTGNLLLASDGTVEGDGSTIFALGVGKSGANE